MMLDLTRREALKLASVAGLAAMGPSIARAADDPRAISKRWRIAYERAVLTDRPVTYWRLGEHSGWIAFDVTGHGHDGRYQGHPAYGETGAIEGDRNTAIGLHGMEYVEIPDSVHFSQPESHHGLTVEVWMRLTPWISLDRRHIQTTTLTCTGSVRVRKDSTSGGFGFTAFTRIRSTSSPRAGRTGSRPTSGI